eukprot:GEMP01032647.1.p1 GENE.GEMP01032647.1~~GEMP01032647.1.p1  ORF type:complete len:238 (+),score=53.70 GEMP01032647.1:38-751(+)
MAQYGKLQYWDDRYTRDPEPFDWYQRWEGLKDVLKDIIQPNHSILMLGSGNSRLSEELYEEGYTNISNIDISMVVTKAMKEKYQDKNMTYAQMDARQMDFPKDHFSIVLDKGTLDSILCGEGSTQNAQKALNEISRVLLPNGVFICISHGEPSYRLTYLHRPEFGWNVTVQTVVKPMMGMVSTMDEQSNVHYVYVCTKGEIFEKWDEPAPDHIEMEEGEGKAAEREANEGENVSASA